MPHPERFAILGRFALDRPESRALIAGWKSRPGMRGLRFTFLQPHQKSWPTDGTMDWLWPAAEKAGMPVALLATDFLPLVGQIAERHPGLKLIVDHMGPYAATRAMPPSPTCRSCWRWPSTPTSPSRRPAAPATPPTPIPSAASISPIARSTMPSGPRRMFWGTDITRMPCSWRQCVTHFAEELPWLPEPDKELIMGRAICDWIGWKI